MSVDETSEGLVIPDNGGSDTEWSAVEIIAPAYVECADCGVYQFSDLPVGRAIPAGAADSGLELERVLEDYQLQTQDRR